MRRLRRLTDHAARQSTPASPSALRFARHEVADAIASICATHLTVIRLVGTLDATAGSDAARRALVLLRRLPAPLGEAVWPAQPDPVTREFFQLYARLTATQRNALLVIVRRATRTGRGKRPSPRSR